MKFRTKLKNEESLDIINYSSKVLCIGSCFAEHLHLFLKRRKYNSFLNPCGITYNPRSLNDTVSYVLNYLSIKPYEIKENNGVFYHSDFHSSFNATSREQAYENITSHLEKAKDFSDADVVILSLGSAFAYEDYETGKIVNNCHKRPSSDFDKKLMSLKTVVELLNHIIQMLQEKNGLVKIIATVSPVRHLRDGMIENNWSKSLLNVALQQVKGITYFPSYELLMDDLRDYRFYATDLVHPSEEAVEYILSSFEGQFFSEDEAHLRKKILQVTKDLEHRAFLPESEQHQKFLQGLLQRMETFQNDCDIDFKKEIALTKSRLL